MFVFLMGVWEGSDLGCGKCYVCCKDNAAQMWNIWWFGYDSLRFEKLKL